MLRIIQGGDKSVDSGQIREEFGGGKLFLVSTIQNSPFNVSDKDLRTTWVLAKKS